MNRNGHQPCSHMYAFHFPGSLCQIYLFSWLSFGHTVNKIGPEQKQAQKILVSRWKLSISAGTKASASKRSGSMNTQAWRLWNEGKGLELVDPSLRDPSWSPEEFNWYMHIGLLCVQRDPNDRPSMSSVDRMLKSESAALQKPERPAFSVGRFTDQQDSNNNCSCSINGASVSDMVARWQTGLRMSFGIYLDSKLNRFTCVEFPNTI